mgnify:CR=1 FL=1
MSDRTDLLTFPATNLSVLDVDAIVKDDIDPSKILKFQLSGITAGATRTLTVPNSDGTIAISGSSVVPNFSGGIITPKIYPSVDSTTAFQINKADGITNVINVDTTNGNVGIGTTGPEQKLHLNGRLALDEANGINLQIRRAISDQSFHVGADSNGNLKFMNNAG